MLKVERCWMRVKSGEAGGDGVWLYVYVLRLLYLIFLEITITLNLVPVEEILY